MFDETPELQNDQELTCSDLTSASVTDRLLPVNRLISINTGIQRVNTMQDLDAVQGIILATLAGTLVWLLIAVVLFH